jgi:hypothetical protein
MSDLEFSDPPPVRRGVEPTRLSQRQEDALRGKPNEWAVVFRRKGNSLAGKLRARHPDFEFTVRKRKDGQGVDIYALYPKGGKR